MTCGYSRSKVLPWGLEGGSEGSPNYVEVVRRDGDSSRYSFVSSLPVNKGDVVRVVTGNGAGFGDPARRNPDAVRRDARNGFISAERAKKIYGVDL
jgi:N-methylhydantoinase B